jgi:hypothetical protein
VDEDKESDPDHNHSVSFATYTQNITPISATEDDASRADEADFKHTLHQSRSAPTSPKKSPTKGDKNALLEDFKPNQIQALEGTSANLKAKNKKDKKDKKAELAAKRKAQKPAKVTGCGAIFTPQGADSNIIRSGHQEFNTLYASNDVVTGPLMVNVLNAPNNSTVQCGCENVNCPFCNLMLSIEKTDPSVLQ